MKNMILTELEANLRKGKSNLVVINVLSKEAFEKEHIPGSINIPLDRPDFIDKVKKNVPDKNAPIVVYCAGPHCPTSAEAAKLLEKAGFTNVSHYKGGMEEWRKSGKTVKARH